MNEADRSLTRGDPLPDDFLALSAALGADRSRVQGPGGNTSIKRDGVMWIKASGAELADARRRPIFVPVSLDGARAQAHGAGDGSCRDCVVDSSLGLRPSIETTFHALIDRPVVAHTHSVNALAHWIGPAGGRAGAAKLAGLPCAFIPYRKPGRALTQAIAERWDARTRVWILENHGLIVAGADAREVGDMIDAVEAALEAPPCVAARPSRAAPPPDGFEWLEEGHALAQDARLTRLATGGSYYPDHVVFLGPALPPAPEAGRPAALIAGAGLALRCDATPAQRAMALCLVDVLTRLPAAWEPTPLTPAQEAELLDWDAEKYRQALARRGLSPAAASGAL